MEVPPKGCIVEEVKETVVGWGWRREGSTDDTVATGGRNTGMR